MTKRQRKRKAFLTSLIALVLSVAMLAGTTFSWFTDSAKNTGNRIVTGIMDVKLLKHDGAAYVDISDGEGDIFKTEGVEGERLNGTLWEPGKTEIVYLAVENAGTLALNYNIVLEIKNGENNTIALEDALEYAVLPGITAENSIYGWETIKAMPEAEIGTVPVGTTTAAPNGALLAGEADYFALAVHMDEDAGNEYQNQELIIDVNVEATQMVSEYDSFSNLYDANAGVTQFGTNLVTSSTPNAVTTLYSTFNPVMPNGTVYAGVIGRLGHTEDGTPYLLFVQQHYTKLQTEVAATTAKLGGWMSKAGTSQSDPHHLELTFSEEKTINRVEMYFDADANFQYPLESYTISYLNSDGVTWTEVAKKEGNSEMLNVFTFEPVTTTKVRVDITDCSRKYGYNPSHDKYGRVYTDDYYARVAEIEVYTTDDTNVARTASIAADSYYKRAAANAIDGNRGGGLPTKLSCAEFWKPSTTQVPHYLVIDLKEPKTFNEIHVNSIDPTDGDRSWYMEYQLQYMNMETSEWVTVASADSANPNMELDVSAKFESVTAQQIRFLVTKTNGDNTKIPKINSFTVYNRTSDNPGENLAYNAKVLASSEVASTGHVGLAAVQNFDSASISCLTAVTLDGEILWQKGTPSSYNYTAGEDLPVQIYDIDQDGAEEIIAVYNDCIQVFSPDGTLEGWTYLADLNADAIGICNVSGNEYASDIYVKDRYREIVTFKYVGEGKFEELWRFCEFTDRESYSLQQMVGHFPVGYDIDGDGKDEIMTGNSFLDDDGTVFVHENGKLANYIIGTTELWQHADGIKIGDFDPDQEGAEVLLAHSLNGNIFINAKGERYCFDLAMGHSQKIVVGEFAPTIRGLESFTTIKEATALYLQKANGERIWPSAITYDIGGVIQTDPSFFIKAGSGQEYLLANRLHTVIDAYNNPIVNLPKDSPRFGWSVNVCGDEREELVLWSNALVQIWTNTAAVPDGGKNLVTDATVITDSTASGSSADYLKDGDREGTMWVSADSPEDHYIIVDFGAVKTFDELWLYGYEDAEETYYPEYFKIQYNVGNATNPQWVEIHDVKANMRKEAAFTFEPVTAQQVRILITDPTTAVEHMDSVARVCEVEIYEALSGVFQSVEGSAGLVDGSTAITFGESKVIDGVSLKFEGEVTGYQLQYNSGTVDAPVWTVLENVVLNTISTNNYAFTPVSTDALRVVVTEGTGTVQTISVREWSGYDYQEIENELIINPTKSGNTGSYKWTQY